jgi:predicted translin family RNA/ssDNA-binding protein
MLNKNFLGKLRQEHEKNEEERRRIISQSNKILHESKRVIFALHRGNSEQAQEDLERIEGCIKKMEKQFGSSRLGREGAYKAGIEEYVEAKFFYAVIAGVKLNRVAGLKIEYDSYLGGLCDLTGEMVRLATNEAAAGRLGRVEELKDMVNQIMEELVGFDFTGYLRTKYDQAKSSLRKIEQINYEVKIRK